ncbi:MAG: hypothetical protein LH475_07705 [Cryobacterium sp.]|uniref:hypothetical protein n=1 Tax=unclassified Cryobacterium TaxID=2649013 RepID=UPI0018CA1D37|nr:MULTISPECIES: hypothetical protein [unclassified Cryobacterium]MCY7404496.1 hypothetical protein [Cryobacterium sp.]MEC5154020.1 hypothetical protein [Cryobacterium sp. CAN_C3]
MEWWNSFVAWFTDVSTQPMVFTAVVFIGAIVIASVLAALISRGAVKRLLTQRDREIKVAAISTLIDAATEASVWNSLTPQEQVMSDRAVGQADIQVRLLPIRGSGIAANWAAHELYELKRTSATFGYQLEPALVEFRDRLVDWQNKPARARKIFQSDLDRWKAQNSSTEKSLLAEQEAWVAQQHHDQYSATDFAPAPLRAAPLTPAAVNRTPASVSTTSPSSASPSTETQRLLDDVNKLEVRSTDPLTRSSAAPTL